MTKASLAQGKQILDLFSGCSSEEVQQFIEAGDLLGMMAVTDLKRVDRRAFADLLAGSVPAAALKLWSTADVLRAFVARNNERGWGFTREQISTLEVSMPADAVSRLDDMSSLEIWLGDLPTTFEELWAWNVHVHGSAWRYDGLKSDSQHLRLLDPEQSYSSQLSARWVKLDITANRGQTSEDIDDSMGYPGLAVLAAAALQPIWLPAIDRDGLLGVWLFGLLAMIPGEHAWRNVPLLFWDHGSHDEVGLHARWSGHRRRDCTVPVFKKL